MSRPLLVVFFAGTVALFACLFAFRLAAPDRFEHWKDVFELLSFIVILLGVPVGLIEYFRATGKEQQDREYGTYNALDEKFLEFQHLCLANPKLDIFDVPDKEPESLSPDEEKVELIAFTMLFSIFERAYLVYHDQSTAIKQKQWTGWDEYIQSYCLRKNFKRAWERSGATFDKDFERYIHWYMRPESARGPAVTKS